MHDGKTCVEAGYKDITSRSQCESAFRLVAEHPGKDPWQSHDVSLCHYTPIPCNLHVDGSFGQIYRRNSAVLV